MHISMMLNQFRSPMNVNNTKNLKIAILDLRCRSIASSPGFTNPWIRNMHDQRSAFMK